MRSERARVLSLAALGAGVAAGLYALEPTLLTETWRSPRALAVVAVTTLAAMLLGRLGRRRGGALLGAVGALLPLLLTGWLVVRPAVRDVRIDEALPVSTVATAPTAPTLSDPLPTAPGAAAPAPAAATPVRVAGGKLAGIGHRASGTVGLYRLADGSHVVQFEDVAIEGSPDPVLYLVPGRNQDSRDGGTRVADLKATHGTFHHVVPASFDLTKDFTVFVWCDRFTTPIARATPTS